jgi:hypothetical protein
MLRRALCLALAFVLVGAPPPALAADPEVERGIAAVDQGEYDSAIVTLDAAVRRLTALPDRQADLAQAYVYLGVAYLAKGHETSARARFRDALRQARDLSLTSDKFAPKVVELFEKAREEVGVGTAPTPAPAAGVPTAAAKPDRKRSQTPLLLVAGLGAAGAGVAIAAGGGGGGNTGGTTTTGGLRDTTFPNEAMPVGGGRDFLVVVQGPGTLTATVTWQPTGVLLDMYVVAVANSGQVLTTSGRTGTTESQLSLPVTAQTYRITVTNSSGQGLQVPSTFNLRVQHP